MKFCDVHHNDAQKDYESQFEHLSTLNVEFIKSLFLSRSIIDSHTYATLIFHSPISNTKLAQYLQSLITHCVTIIIVTFKNAIAE